MNHNTNRNLRKLICVVGPTGSGKTAYGVALAKKLNGVIISADSRQVYIGLDIGTNKEGIQSYWNTEPSRQINDIHQLLIDIVAPQTSFTVADWQSEAKRLIQLIEANDQQPIIVGGTGLYVSALVSNYQFSSSDQKLKSKLTKLKLEELQKKVIKENINLNASDFQNKVRLINALSRDAAPKESTSQAVPSTIFEINTENAILFKRSDQRYVRIFDDLVKETLKLIESGVSQDWLERLGLDYRYAVRYLQGKLTKEEAILQFNSRSHAYIRRQKTWWRYHEKTIILPILTDY